MPQAVKSENGKIISTLQRDVVHVEQYAVAPDMDGIKMIGGDGIIQDGFPKELALEIKFHQADTKTVVETTKRTNMHQIAVR